MAESPWKVSRQAAIRYVAGNVLWAIGAPIAMAALTGIAAAVAGADAWLLILLMVGVFFLTVGTVLVRGAAREVPISKVDISSACFVPANETSVKFQVGVKVTNLSGAPTRLHGWGLRLLWNGRELVGGHLFAADRLPGSPEWEPLDWLASNRAMEQGETLPGLVTFAVPVTQDELRAALRDDSSSLAIVLTVSDQRGREMTANRDLHEMRRENFADLSAVPSPPRRVRRASKASKRGG